MKISLSLLAVVSALVAATPAVAADTYVPECLTKIQDHAYLGSLDLSNCGLADENMPAIINFLKSNPQLVTINLSNNYFHSKAAKQLAAVSLVVTDPQASGNAEPAINFDDNHIGDEGVIAFANKSLGSFEAKNNQVTDKGAMVIAQNNSLRGLDLSENRITDKGAAALAQNTSVGSLDLAYNLIGDAGAAALAHNQVISQLFLDGNLIGDAGALAFPKFRPNGSEFDLRMSYNNIGAEAVKVLMTTYGMDDWSLMGNPGLPDAVNKNVSQKKSGNFKFKK